VFPLPAAGPQRRAPGALLPVRRELPPVPVYNSDTGRWEDVRRSPILANLISDEAAAHMLHMMRQRQPVLSYRFRSTNFLK
jgi:hypothetical protein